MTLPDGQQLRWDMGPEYTWDGMVPNSAYPPTAMQQNDIAIVITPAQETEIIGLADQLAEKIAVFARTLTDQQRQSYFKLGDARLAFHQKSHDYIHQQADTVPPTVNISAYDADKAAWECLSRITAKMATINRPLEDTQIVVGADLLNADLAYYNYLPLAAKAGISGAEVIYADLKGSYPGRGPKPPPAPTPPAP